MKSPIQTASSLSPQSFNAPAVSTRLSRARLIFPSLLVVAAILWGIYYGLHSYHYETTDDAYVTGRLHQVSTQLDGQVMDVLVQENQAVHAGDVLLRLDPLSFQISLQIADANLALSRAQEAQIAAVAIQAVAVLDEAHARAAQAEAQFLQADAQLANAKLILARNEMLLAKGGAVTVSDVDNARTAAKAAQAIAQAAQANLLATRASISSAESAQASVNAQITAAAANTRAAEAAHREAERKLALTAIVAPVDGRIGNKHVETGNRVQAGQALLALVESEMWIVANFKETQLTHMTPGQVVKLTVDALPGREMQGKLDSLSPASGAQFALLPADNSSGNFTKVVQRVPVRITLDPDSRTQLGDSLRLGLSVAAEVRIR